jgi:hypothetical protein
MKTKYILITLLSLFLFASVASAQSFYGHTYTDSYNQTFTGNNGGSVFGVAQVPGYGYSSGSASFTGIGTATVKGSVNVYTKSGWKGSVVKSSSSAKITSKSK